MRRRLLLIVHHRGHRVAEGHQVASAIGHLHLALPLRWVLIRLLSQRVLLLTVVVVRILQDGRKPLLDVAKRARRHALVKVHIQLDVRMHLLYWLAGCLCYSKMPLLVHHLNLAFEAFMKSDQLARAVV